MGGRSNEWCLYINYHSQPNSKFMHQADSFNYAIWDGSAPLQRFDSCFFRDLVRYINLISRRRSCSWACGNITAAIRPAWDYPELVITFSRDALLCRLPSSGLASVRPSVCPIVFCLTVIERAAHTQRDSPGGTKRRGQRTFPSEYYEVGHNLHVKQKMRCYSPFVFIAVTKQQERVSTSKYASHSKISNFKFHDGWPVS